MFSYWAPPASAPLPRRTARSMLSFGTELFLAFWMASYSVGLPAGSPPPVRAATSTFLISLANILPRLASMTAFLCLVVAHLECPDIYLSVFNPIPACRRPAQRSAGAPSDHPSAPGGTRWRAGYPAVPRRSYRRPDRPRRGQGPRRPDRPIQPTARG